jgi:hypothetical protein
MREPHLGLQWSLQSEYFKSNLNWTYSVFKLNYFYKTAINLKYFYL